jgi:hypothetical protein
MEIDTKMRRETAERLIASMRKLDASLGELHTIWLEIEDEVERKKFQRAYVEIISDLHLKITMEAVKQFPDLHPDK